MTAVLGLDGGGTKTHVVIADEGGGLLGAAVGGASNWEDVGLEGAASAIRAVALEALHAAQLSPEDIDASVFGLAGDDWPSDQARLSTIPASLGLSRQQEIVNDAFVALRAGANHPWGIAVVAGTGTVTAGRNAAGEEFRTLGLGPLYGDFGGSTEIADEGLRAVAEAFTGLGPPTTITAGYLAGLGRSTPEDLLEFTSRKQPPLSDLATVCLRPPMRAIWPPAPSSSAPAPHSAPTPAWPHASCGCRTSPSRSCSPAVSSGPAAAPSSRR